MLYSEYFTSPIGNIQIIADDAALFKLSFVSEIPQGLEELCSCPVIEETKKQLELYFTKKLQKFELPISFRGSDFQKHVLDEVQKIPFGQTITYMQLAHRLGSTRLTRAIAGANAANPFLIIIPCHRVVGKNNNMTGYAGEIWRKEWLLKHENAIIPLVF